MWVEGNLCACIPMIPAGGRDMLPAIAPIMPGRTYRLGGSRALGRREGWMEGGMQGGRTGSTVRITGAPNWFGRHLKGVHACVSMGGIWRWGWAFGIQSIR